MLSLLWSSTKDTIECDEAHSGGLFFFTLPNPATLLAHLSKGIGI